MNNSYDFGITNLQGVVESINNSPVQGFEQYTPAFKAASYAYEAQIASGYEISEEAIETHLDILVEAGAEFDYFDALSIALK